MTWNKAEYQWYHFGVHRRSPNSSTTRSVRMLSRHARGPEGHGCPLTEELGHDRRLVEEVPGRVPVDRAPPAAGWGRSTFGPRASGPSAHWARTWTACRSTSARSNPTSTSWSTRFCTCDGCHRWTTVPDRHHDRGPDRLRRQVAGGQPRRAGQEDRSAISLRMTTRENIGFGIDQTHVRPARRRHAAVPHPPEHRRLLHRVTAGVLRRTVVDAVFDQRPARGRCRPRATATCRAWTRP